MYQCLLIHSHFFIFNIAPFASLPYFANVHKIRLSTALRISTTKNAHSHTRMGVFIYIYKIDNIKMYRFVINIKNYSILYEAMFSILKIYI